MHRKKGELSRPPDADEVQMTAGIILNVGGSSGGITHSIDMVQGFLVNGWESRGSCSRYVHPKNLSQREAPI
jgi:hypothetical protein